MVTHLDFYDWVREDFGWRDDFGELVAFDNPCKDGRVDIRIKRDRYGIFANDPTLENPEGSLFCLGSDYDLPRGPLTRETWYRILADIVANELRPPVDVDEAGFNSGRANDCSPDIA